MDRGTVANIFSSCSRIPEDRLSSENRPVLVLQFRISSQPALLSQATTRTVSDWLIPGWPVPQILDSEYGPCSSISCNANFRSKINLLEIKCNKISNYSWNRITCDPFWFSPSVELFRLQGYLRGPLVSHRTENNEKLNIVTKIIKKSGRVASHENWTVG